MTKYRLTESAKEKYQMVGVVLLLTGVAPMFLAGLLFEVLGL